MYCNAQWAQLPVCVSCAGRRRRIWRSCEAPQACTLQPAVFLFFAFCILYFGFFYLVNACVRCTLYLFDYLLCFFYLQAVCICIHSKSEKVCGTTFFSKKNLRKKCVNPGVIFGPFGVILGRFRSFLVIFGSL